MGNDLLRISLKLFFTFQIDDLRTIIGMNKKEVAFPFHCYKKWSSDIYYYELISPDSQ